MDVKQLLIKTTLFSGISEKELDRLTPYVQTVNIPEHETFIRKGEAADALYVIEKGVCQIYSVDESGSEIILARLEEGAYFGEQALLSEVPGKRNASVRALSNLKLLKLLHANFQTVLHQNNALKAMLEKIGSQQLQANLVMENLHKIHLSEKRGEVRQYNGKFLDMPALVSNFRLENGQEIFVARVLDQSIQTAQKANLKSPEEKIFIADNIRRELFLEDNVLVGVTSYGEWESLPQIINMVFNQTPLDQQQLTHFSETGNLVVILPEVCETETNDKKIICNCMYISKDEIKKQIQLGAIDLEGISNATGAGTVCGTCRPGIQGILGHTGWQPVRIKQILPLTSTIHAYQLIPALGETLFPYQPGQHLTVQGLVDGNWVERAYTLTSRPGRNTYYEIAVKHEEKGLFSNWLFANEGEIPLLRVSLPEGGFLLNLDLKSPIICLMAGIGITPAVSFARAAIDSKSQRPLYIHFSARTDSDFAYLDILKIISEKHPPVKILTRATQKEGHLEKKDLASFIEKFSNADYYICGPTGYVEAVQQFLKELGVPESNLFIEKFTHANEI